MNRQTFFALLLGPLAVIPATLLAAALIPLLSGDFRPGEALPFLGGTLVTALVIVIYAYAFTLFYGLPVYLLLKRLGWLGNWSIAISSLLPSALICLLVPASIVFIAMINYLSLVTGMACWFVHQKCAAKN